MVPCISLLDWTRAMTDLLMACPAVPVTGKQGSLHCFLEDLVNLEPVKHTNSHVTTPKHEQNCSNLEIMPCDQALYSELIQAGSVDYPVVFKCL